MMSNTKQQIRENTLRMQVIEAMCFKPNVDVHLEQLERVEALIDRLVTEARIKGINEAHKEIMEIAYTYAGDDELSDFCGVDDLSRVAMSWKVERIAELQSQLSDKQQKKAD